MLLLAAFVATLTPPQQAVTQNAPALVATDQALTAFLDDGTGDRSALVASLRARGQAGLDAVLRTLEFDDDGVPVLHHTAREDRALKLVDDVAQQKNAAYTRAFWFTSLDDAIKLAKKEHKPVLSLRLLGSLDDELSCANSRYFRSLVYPDAKVSALLRDQFVLHWQSVRPVPKVTIDMGDGRKMENTITGNSAHIILDETGAVVDALPGLYDAPHFAAALEDALTLAHSAHRADEHLARVAVIDRAWKSVSNGAALPELDNDSTDHVNALAISPRAMMKAIPERQILMRLFNQRAPELSPLFIRIGAQQRTQLSAGALAIFRTQLAPSSSESYARSTVERTIAADTAQNEYVFHRQVHIWLAHNVGNTSSSMQQKLYNDIFLTPDRDPWLGLAAPDSYNGIDHGGVH